MKSVIAFIVVVGAGLAFATVGHVVVGLDPMPRDIGNAERIAHLWLVLLALAIVIGVDAVVVVLALRRGRPGRAE